MRTAELTLLLELSSAIATIKNEDELFQLIFEKINPIFDCPSESAILIADKDDKHYRLMIHESLNLPFEEIEYYKNNPLPIDPVMRMIMETEGAQIIQTENLIEKNIDKIGAKIAKKLGVKEMISCRLQVR